LCRCENSKHNLFERALTNPFEVILPPLRVQWLPDQLDRFGSPVFQFDLTWKKSACRLSCNLMVELVRFFNLFKPLSSSTPSSCISQYLPHYPPGHYPTSSFLVSNSTNPSSCRGVPCRQLFLLKALSPYPGSIGVSVFFASRCAASLSTQVRPSWLLLSLCPLPVGAVDNLLLPEP
jgi:hypothetical protein